MTLNLNDLMIFLESQFIHEQHAQAVSFRRHRSSLTTGYSDGRMGAKHQHCHRILSALVQNTGRHVWQEAGCWGDNGQWVVTGGSVVTTGHLINISISRVIHCLLLPGPGPFMSSPGRAIHSQSRLFFAQLGCFIHPPVFPLARPRPGLFLPGFSV